jgi:hypothetical protein
VQEINVSRAGDPVHVGDKALMRETPAQRGRVNRYDTVICVNLSWVKKSLDCYSASSQK